MKPLVPPSGEHRPLTAIPIADVAVALELDVRYSSARCFGGATHVNGCEHVPLLVFFTDINHYECLHCGTAGDVIDLVRGVLRVDYPQAIEWLQANIPGATFMVVPTVHRVPPGTPDPSDGFIDGGRADDEEPNDE